jgi:hypothetical protein
MPSQWGQHEVGTPRDDAGTSATPHAGHSRPADAGIDRLSPPYRRINRRRADPVPPLTGARDMVRRVAQAIHHTARITAPASS